MWLWGYNKKTIAREKKAVSIRRQFFYLFHRKEPVYLIPKAKTYLLGKVGNSLR